jgi:DNA-binding transcriptional MerR regulator
MSKTIIEHWRFVKILYNTIYLSLSIHAGEETMAESEVSASGYKIGTVSKLTGISPDTLRIWERRYAVVTPQRSPGGGRLYTTEDIARLKLIRRLVDRGDTIGVIGGLSHDELQQRLVETRNVEAIAAPGAPCRLAVVGELLNLRLEAERESLSDVTIAASYDSTRAFMADTGLIEADVLVIDQPTLQLETVVQVADWIERVNAVHAVIIYRFAARETLAQLPQSKCSTLRAPVDPLTIQSHCIAQMGRQASIDDVDADYALVAGEPAPPRRYNDETLARLAGLSSTIKCECPQHLAELVTSLGAFEKYSNECESRSIKDAELHAYLSNTAAHARHMFENALSLVIEAENIEL